MAISPRTWTNNDGSTGKAYVARYKDQGGKWRTKQFEKRKEADAFITRAKGEVSHGIHTPDSTSLTISQAADVWLGACKAGRDGEDPVEPHTLRAYKSHIVNHIEPMIGATLLSQCTGPMAKGFRDDLLARLSRPMAKKVLVSFKSIINECHSRGFVASNIVGKVTIKNKGRHKKKIVPPSSADVKAILSTAKQWSNADADFVAEHAPRSDPKRIAKAWKRYHALLMAAILTGLRPSELRGLPWSAVNFKKKVLTVKQKADEKGIISSPKSEASLRDIPLTPNLAIVLKEWKLLCPSNELVFPNWQGNVENLSNIHRRCWNKIKERAGVPHLKNLYTLRHYRASRLIAAGSTPKEVQVEMGHASIQLTFDTYGHLFEEDNQARVQRAVNIEAEICS